VRILKGCVVGDGSIVATGAILTKVTKVPNVLIAGVPGRVVKEGVVWSHSRSGGVNV
jgi:carbonic anhydrase/acetyltransferase-like protein (isoleucine patch superfamily)